MSTEVFEGPLDLLLQLITARRVEITEVSLSDLVGEYLGYLDVMRELDLEVTSEFLVIAATLIQLKARRLLPDDVAVDLDEELALAEERDRLLARLLASLTYKDVAAVMAHRIETTSQLIPRRVGLEGVTARPPEVRLSVDADGLAALAGRVIGARSMEPDLDHLDLDLPSVAEAIADVRARVRTDLDTDFDSLIAHTTRTVEVVAYFLAVLELARWGLVTVTQAEPGTTITVTRGADDAEFVSEWQA